MTADELKKLLEDVPKSISNIEAEIGMPKTTLQKAIKGQRGLAKKWVIALKNYVNSKQYVLSTPMAHIPPSKREIVSQVLGANKPQNLEELKKMCPSEFGTYERAEWIAIERQKWGI